MHKQLASHHTPLNWLAHLPPCGGCGAARASFHAARVFNPIKFVVRSGTRTDSSMNERRQFTRNTALAPTTDYDQCILTEVSDFFPSFLFRSLLDLVRLFLPLSSSFSVHRAIIPSL